jgi:cellulose synthase/poly-beta-1,6-N-acetylglucosamine synthase-like glycosyltransferase
VTIAVPVKDRRERMLRCLDSLLRIDYPCYEVLVLDNESSDGTAEACRERGPAARVPLRVEVLAGSVGELRNRAPELARGSIMAFTDSDCVVDSGWLRAGVSALLRAPDVGLVTGRTEAAEPTNGGWPATLEVHGRSGRFESCNVFFRTEPFRASEGFDEVVGHFWEDTAAGFAMRRAGWKDAYEPAAIVYHDVTYPGFLWHLRRAQRQANLAHVVRRYPEMRRDVLWARVFLRPRDAKLLALVAAGSLARRQPLLAAALAAPYLHERGPHSPHPQQLVEFAQRMIYDAATVLGCARGSVRHRTITL